MNFFDCLSKGEAKPEDPKLSIKPGKNEKHLPLSQPQWFELRQVFISAYLLSLAQAAFAAFMARGVKINATMYRITYRGRKVDRKAKMNAGN